MEIRKSYQSITFGKTPVMTCEVKRKSDQQRIKATLYKMDLKNHNDLDEIKYSKTTKSLYYDAEKDSRNFSPYRDYYLLKADDTKEVISGLSVTSHFRRGEERTCGLSFVVDAMEGNNKYVSSTDPILAYLANEAINNYRENIIIGNGDIDEKNLRREKFTKSKIGEWFLPQQRFTQLIDQAEKRYNMVI